MEKLPNKIVFDSRDIERYDDALFERLCEAIENIIVDCYENNVESYSWEMKVEIDDIEWEELEND